MRSVKEEMPDDRIMCKDCANLTPKGCEAYGGYPVTDILRRCPQFKPKNSREFSGTERGWTEEMFANGN